MLLTLDYLYIGCDTSSISNCISQLGKLHLFLVYWSTRYYSWFLVAITCERFMCVCLPRKVKQCCTRRAALFVIYVITGSLMMLNIHLLYGFGNLTLTINHNETKVSDCVLAAEDVYIFLIYAWDWIDLCMFCLIPFWCCYLDMFPYLCNTNVLKCCKPCSVLP